MAGSTELSQLGTLTEARLQSSQVSPSSVTNSLQAAIWYHGLLGTSGLDGSPGPLVILGAFTVKHRSSWGMEKSAKEGDSLVTA